MSEARPEFAAYQEAVGEIRALLEWADKEWITPKVVIAAFRALESAQSLLTQDGWGDLNDAKLEGSVEVPGEGFVPAMDEYFAQAKAAEASLHGNPTSEDNSQPEPPIHPYQIYGDDHETHVEAAKELDKARGFGEIP